MATIPRGNELPKVLVQDDPQATMALDQWRAILNPLMRRTANRPVVTGAKGGNVALTSLISALADLGLIVDETT